METNCKRSGATKKAYMKLEKNIKNYLWKGIAIAGLWIGCSLVSWAYAWIIITKPEQRDEFSVTSVYIFAFILICVIVNKK